MKEVVFKQHLSVPVFYDLILKPIMTFYQQESFLVCHQRYASKTQGPNAANPFCRDQKAPVGCLWRRR